MIEPKIVETEEKKLVGKRMTFSLSNDKTGALWQSFMPHRHSIQNRKGKEYYSIQQYGNGLDLERFDEETVFEKWAAVEVSSYSNVPKDMEMITIPAGKYANFIHHGLANEFSKTLDEFYNSWLPGSGFQLDVRPHFEVMGERYYGPTDANSEEEIWIPVK